MPSTIPVHITGWQPGPLGHVTVERNSTRATSSNMHYPVLVFNTTASTRYGATARFYVPPLPAALTAAAIQIIFDSTVTSGNVVWDVDLIRVRATDTFNTATLLESLSMTIAVPGTAYTRPATPSTVAMTHGSYQAGDFIQIGVYRDKTDAADTATGFQRIQMVLCNLTVA